MANCSEGFVEEKWVNVLAHVWNQVRWRRMRGRRYLDVFEHRLEYSKYELDVASALQRLANSLSIQGVYAPIEDIEVLRVCNDMAMDVLRRWTKLLALKASIKARELRGVQEEVKPQTTDINVESVSGIGGGEGGGDSA